MEQEVKARSIRWQIGRPKEPIPAPVPVGESAKAKWMPVPPPASARTPVMVTESLAARATFSGVSGWRKPGVNVSTEVALTARSLLRVAVTTTCARSVVKYPGGEYCPVFVIVPAPAFGSPPATDHATSAGPPLLRVAVN